MWQVFESIVDAVSGSNWSYLIVFVIAMLDAFFPVVPSEATAITAGVVAGTGGLSGRARDPRRRARGDRGRQHLLLRRPFPRRAAESALLPGWKGKKRVLWARKMLEERGGYIIVVARFIPGGRTVVTFTAGFMDGMPWRRFIRYDVIAGVIWGTYAVMLGYIGGKSFEEQPWKGLVLAFVFALAVTGLVEVIRYIRHRRAAPA